MPLLALIALFLIVPFLELYVILEVVGPALGAPLTIAPVWGPRSIDLCNGGDPICQTDGETLIAHRSPNYAGAFATQAADFAAGRV